MELSLKDKKSITKAFAKKYLLSRKKYKGYLINEFVRLTNYNRTYAANLLRNYKNKSVYKKRFRKPKYNTKIRDVLSDIWKIMDYICGQRLAPILPEIVKKLEHFGEIKIDKETKEKLCKISSATIDRLLEPMRAIRGRKNRSHTKPGNFLKKQIPIRTYGEWPENEPGYIEVDLVSHEGGDNSGQYFWTLNATDIHSTWTISIILEGKTQEHVLKGLKIIKKKLPFKLKGLDTDNGSEFINHIIVNFCKKNNIKFTRCRPYKKNDNCYVEQKNYSVVRRNIGYLRYDTDEEFKIIQNIYDNLHLYNNFFQPTKKLLSKTKLGSKYIRKYDTAKSPYYRLLSSEKYDENEKSNLIKVYSKLNPAELKRKITMYQNKLIKITRKKPNIIKQYLDKEDKNRLMRYKKRNRPSIKNPSIFVENQNQEIEKLRETVKILDRIRK